MPWFVDESAIIRRGVGEFLSLLPRLQVVISAMDMLNAGCSPAEAAQVLGEGLNSLARAESKTAELLSRLSAVELDLNFFQREVERLRADPLREQVARLQFQVQEQSRRADQTERQIELKQKASRLLEQDIARLQQTILEQNRLITRQHNQLEGLLGAGDTPE